MAKKTVVAWCAALMAVVGVGGCAPDSTYVPPTGTVAIAFVTDEGNYERWGEELLFLAASFQQLNYSILTINVQDGDTAKMTAHLNELIGYMPNTLIFVTPNSSSTTVSKALNDLVAACSTKILCYDRLQLGTKAIAGYLASPLKAIGKLQGEALAALPDGSKIEVLAGPKRDNTALPLYQGVMEEIESKLAANVWSIPSQAVAFNDATLTDWSKAEAKKRMTYLLENHYPDPTMPDAIVAANDAQAAGVYEAIALLRPKAKVPIITGMGSTQDAWSRITFDKQTMTVTHNPVKFTATAIAIIEAWNKGTDYIFEASTDNGLKIVPTTIVNPVKSIYKKDLTNN